MKIVLDTVSKGPALPALSLSFQTGRVTTVGVETAQRPTVLGLVAAGRMRPDTGTVTLDGATDYGRIRTAIALVDAPDVSEPNAAVTLAGVTAEELMFAGRSGSPWKVTEILQQLGATDYTRTTMADIPPAVRIRVLAELALLRPGTIGVVLTSPDRHGGDPGDWEALAQELAGRGLAVLVIVGRASALSVPGSEIEPAEDYPAGAADAVAEDDVIEEKML